MINTLFKNVYIGLVICLLLPGLSFSSPLPSTTEPPESNIISFLNQPGAGNHHYKKDDDDDDSSIKPLDDILGLNFDLFDSWAKNSKSSTSSSSTSSSVINNNENEKQDHDATITPTTNIMTTTEHTNILFPENRPLQQFHNTFHQIFATIRNQITDAIEQRRSSRIIKNTRNETDDKNSSTTTTAATTTTNKSEKLRIRYHHSHHDHIENTNSTNNSSILEDNKNISKNITSEPRSSRLIDNSPIQLSESNILTVDLPTNFDNKEIADKIYMRLNDSQNEFKKNMILSENVNNILLLMNNSNIENTIYNITSNDSFTTKTTTNGTTTTTTPFIDLLNENDDDDKMIIENNNNNLFITGGEFRNRTKALVSFVFTPFLNIWSIAQRNLPTWIPTFNFNNNNEENNMAEIMLDDDSLSEFNPEETGNNQTLEVELLEMKNIENFDNNNYNNNNNYLSNIRNFSQRIFTERIPSVISRIRQSISLPISLPLYQNNGGQSINNVYRKLNERMPFRKEFRKYATSHINDDDDDDDDDYDNNEKYTTKQSTQNPITTTTKQINLNNETQQQFKHKSQQQKLQQIIDQNSNKTFTKKEQEGNGDSNGNKINNLSKQINDNDDTSSDDENLIILNSKEYDDDDDNINQMNSAVPVSASPRMYTESFGIYVLELFGTIVGLTWGALSTIQNLFTKS